MNIREISKLSIKQKSILEKCEKCGCYHCEQILPVEEITKWTDEGQTAICPKCGVDAILAGVTDGKLLSFLRNYFF